MNNIRRMCQKGESNNIYLNKNKNKNKKTKTKTKKRKNEKTFIYMMQRKML